MSEMIERVAEALCKADARRPLSVVSINWQDYYRHQAETALKAMREPTEEMVTAGLYAEGHVPEDEANRATQAMAYTAMIDAALSPSPKGKGEEGWPGP